MGIHQFNLLKKVYINVAKPETLNLIRATDFTVRKLRGDRPLGNSIGALLGQPTARKD